MRSPLLLLRVESASNGTLLTNHSVNLASLTASTTYYIVVASKDAVNNLATSSQTSFTTSN